MSLAVVGQIISFSFLSVCSEFAEEMGKMEANGGRFKTMTEAALAALLPEDPAGMRRFVIHVSRRPTSPKRNEQFLSLTPWRITQIHFIRET